MADYGKTAKAHAAAITDFLAELGEQPDDVKDRVMEGARNGMDEMPKAAPDEDLLDLAVNSASQTGIQYFYNTFAGQPDMAKPSILAVRPTVGRRWRRSGSLSISALPMRHPLFSKMRLPLDLFQAVFGLAHPGRFPCQPLR